METNRASSTQWAATLAAYDVSNCIAEHYVQNSNGGGIAFIGNSRYGWYYAGSFDTLSMGYDIQFFESIFQDNLYKLGQPSQITKMRVLMVAMFPNIVTRNSPCLAILSFLSGKKTR